MEENKFKRKENTYNDVFSFVWLKRKWKENKKKSWLQKGEDHNLGVVTRSKLRELQGDINRKMILFVEKDDGSELKIIILSQLLDWDCLLFLDICN